VDELIVRVRLARKNGEEEEVWGLAQKTFGQWKDLRAVWDKERNPLKGRPLALGMGVSEATSKDRFSKGRFAKRGTESSKKRKMVVIQGFS